MRERILVIDMDGMSRALRFMSLREVGSAFLVALHIAQNGPIPIAGIRNTARLKGCQKWFDEFHERILFVRNGEFLENRPAIFSVKHRGSDNIRAYMPDSFREFIHERDNYKCSYCGTDDGPFEIDHIYPISRGGGGDADNLCLACKPCNRSKSNKLVSEWTR